ncbi:MAG: 1-acyl-sn-glycerol-3-phosphate acyltransferase [Bacteroidales bacterium]|nr:1-acyl-sn-glycerol-3-phosphate acyltransferase [Bacteroidales bacterium]
MWAKFCGFLLRAMGWTAATGPVAENKAIILGVPHTSFWDFVISYLFYTSLNAGKAKVLIKKELFWGPLGWLLRKLGGIPVDRSNSTALVKSVIDAFEKDDYFVLAIAPEGTRKAVRKWKTGYHLMAKAAGIPVYLGYFDWGTKRVGVGEKFELTDDAKADTARIQEIYESMNLVGKNPEGYTAR